MSQIKWIYVIVLEKCSYFYTQINDNQMQSELFNNMFDSSSYIRPFKRAAMMLKMSLTPCPSGLRPAVVCSVFTVQ